MPRQNMQLHPYREPAVPRAAATVILLRDSAHGLEVLMTKRSATASFAPGAYVFPGGGIDLADAQRHQNMPADEPGLSVRPTQPDDLRTATLAAIRESFEELGILLATKAGEWATDSDIQSLDRHGDFYVQCEAAGYTLRADHVFSFTRWITDRDIGKRFDVPFLMARMPSNQTPVADESEQFEPVWIQPAEGLAAYERGEFNIIYPTIKTLQELCRFKAVDDALAACAHEKPLYVVCPRSATLKGREVRYMDHEPPFGELALVCPDGQTLHALDWQSERAVPLLKNVQRLTCANAGVMTGPGTNTYIVGTPDTGYIVIDPGPIDAAHTARLAAATAGDVRAIICTHSHPDHSPGAPDLRAVTRNALTGQVPPICGLPHGPDARPDSHFAPDRVVHDGDRWALSGDTTHTLQVLFTPGHTQNHVCLLLEEDGLLFSGDHILNGSTTIINPDDGHMGDYLSSLDKLKAACTAHSADFILPAHGHVLDKATTVIDKLKAHRLNREAKVKAALDAYPNGDMDQWVAHAYQDTPQVLWPLAKRSMLAHIKHLKELAEAAG